MITLLLMLVCIILLPKLAVEIANKIADIIDEKEKGNF